MHALFLDNCLSPDLNTPSLGQQDAQVFLRLHSAYWPPLFWWALFTRQNLVEMRDSDNTPHHFLLATKAEVLNTWFIRQEALKALIPEADHIVIHDFTRFLQEAMGAGYFRLYISPLDDSQSYTLQDWSSIINERDGQWLRLEQAKNPDVIEEFDSLYMDWEQIKEDYASHKRTNPYILFGGELKGRWPTPKQAEYGLDTYDKRLRLSATDTPQQGIANASPPSGVTLENQDIKQTEVPQALVSSITPTQRASQNRTPKLSLILVIIAAILLSYTYFKY